MEYGEIWNDRARQFEDRRKKEGIGDFLNWSITQSCLFSGTTFWTDKQYAALDDLLLLAIDDPGVGNPSLYEGHTSGNYVNQAFHLKQWLDRTNLGIDKLGVVLEIGGGYGAMVVIMRRLGFTGKYIIYDLPELCRLQMEYLSACEYREGVKFVSSLDGRTAIACDLMIANCSLSEIPDVSKRLDIINKIYDRECLVTYQSSFYDINNDEFIRQHMTAGYTKRIFYSDPDTCMHKYFIGLGKW